MGSKIKVFVDSDVVIASVLSKTGAGYQLLEKKTVDRWISELSEKEMRKVVRRKGFDERVLNVNLEKMKVLSLTEDEVERADMGGLVRDARDVHVVVGAVECGAEFLLTYNLSDFRVGRIKDELGIMCMKPGYFLQFLRGRSNG